MGRVRRVECRMSVFVVRWKEFDVDCEEFDF